MAQLVVLISADQDEPSLGARNVEALARLGVTSVSVARDERTAAVVLEGWALDPSQRAEALAALGTSDERARALRPVVQMAVSVKDDAGGIQR
jgi:hypothetical protein